MNDTSTVYLSPPGGAGETGEGRDDCVGGEHGAGLNTAAVFEDAPGEIRERVGDVQCSVR